MGSGERIRYVEKEVHRKKKKRDMCVVINGQYFTMKASGCHISTEVLSWP